MERTFLDLSHKDIKDVEQVSTLEKMGWSGAFGWERLLQSSRIMIISEAGTGKTYECKEQKKYLWRNGEPAFYLELSELARNELRELLFEDEIERLDKWLISESDVATFFLDSIDELNLTQGSLKTALTRLAKTLGKCRNRARVIITSRPVDLSIDLPLFEEILDYSVIQKNTAEEVTFADVAMGRVKKSVVQKEDASSPVWRMVALMPLADKQIQAMAELQGVSDSAALLEDIRNRNAEDFARRPLDLIELCAVWREQRCIRTHKEQVEYDIRIKLKPHRDAKERADLSPERVYEGATRLALASVLTKKLTFQHNSQLKQSNEVVATALDPQSVLLDWTSNEVKALLERALFGVTGYGRVRFHHRSVIDFLAADRLSFRIKQGASIKSIKRLLFTETPQGIKVIRPSMRSVSAWLSAKNESIFSEVLTREPEVLLGFGDPETLTVAHRVKALKAYVQMYGKGGWRGLHIPRIQVHRFASSDLTTEVLDLWNAGIENPEVRGLLIDLMGQGRMHSCEDVLFRIATNASELEDARLSAITALAAISEIRLLEIIESIDSSLELWPDSLTRSIIARVFPKYITPIQLCHIFENFQIQDRTIDEFSVVFPKKIEEEIFNENYLNDLRICLTDLVLNGVSWSPTWPNFQCPKADFLPALSLICKRLIQEGNVDDDVLYSAVIAIRLDKNLSGHDDAIKSLRKEISICNAHVREKIFWIDDNFNEQFNSKKVSAERFSAILYTDGPLDLSRVQDGSWIRDALSDRSRCVEQRALMLEAALFLFDEQSITNELSEDVCDVVELSARLATYLAPRSVSIEMQRMNRRHERIVKLGNLRQEKAHASWQTFSNSLLHEANGVWELKNEESTCFDLWRAMGKIESDNHFSKWNRQFIVEHFNEKTADRFRFALMRVWRKYCPALSSEKTGNTFPLIWAVGLTGISAEAEDSEWAKKLSDSEAELAARYVLVELNGFPAWLDSLVAAKPNAVEKTLGSELVFELSGSGRGNSFFAFLQNLRNSTSIVNKIFLPVLLKWLVENVESHQQEIVESNAIDRLERVIQILLQHGDEDIHAAIQAKAKIELLNPSMPHAMSWLTALIRLDPLNGVIALEEVLNTIEPEPNGLGVKIFGSLFGHRHLSVDISNPKFTPKLLSRLIVLAYRHVDPSHDYVHKGVYSPDARDHAERGRSALLSTFLNAKGEDSWPIKLAIASDPLFANFRDRFNRIALEKLADEMDIHAWTESEFAYFEARGEAKPKTPQEMFNLLTDRLDDLDEVLLQDDTPREVWAMIREEKLMRREISRNLRNLANDAYLVNQEEVTADENRTDIRLHTCQQQAVIELKVGEQNWSGRELRSVLKDQLVSKYMAPENCRTGCLLITVASDRKWEHPDTGEKLDVDGLVDMLSKEARKLEVEMAFSFRLVIKVLDLRSRFSH